MTLVAVLGGLIFPGLGHAFANDRRWALVWAVGIPLVWIASLFVSPWCFLISQLLRLPAAFLGGWATRSVAKPEWLAATPAIVVCIGILGVIGTRVVVVAGRVPTSSMYPTLEIGDHFFVNRFAKTIDRGDIITFAYPCDTERQYLKRVVGLPGDTIEVRCGILYVNGTATPTTNVPGECSYFDINESEHTWSSRTCSRYREELNGHAYDTFSDAQRPTREKDPNRESDPRDFPSLGSRTPPACNDLDTARGARDTTVEATLASLVVTKPNASACEQQMHFVVPKESYFAIGDNRSNSNDSRYWGPIAKKLVEGKVVGVWLNDGHDGRNWSRIGRVH